MSSMAFIERHSSSYSECAGFRQQGHLLVESKTLLHVHEWRMKADAGCCRWPSRADVGQCWPQRERCLGLSSAAIRPFICLSVCPMPITAGQRCILGLWLLFITNRKPHAQGEPAGRRCRCRNGNEAVVTS